MAELAFILFAIWVSSACGVGLALFAFTALMKPSLEKLIYVSRFLSRFIRAWAALGILATILAILAAWGKNMDTLYLALSFLAGCIAAGLVFLVLEARR